MAIESLNNRIQQLRPNTPAKPVDTGKTGQTASKPVEQGDTVAITSAAQELKKASNESLLSAFNTDKVNAVKKALAEGNYSINPERLAEKIIQFDKPVSANKSN